MSQTEKYYRKYRKYKKQYLYYKQYLEGGAEAEAQARQAIIDAERRKQEEAKIAKLQQGKTKVEKAENRAAADNADGAAGVSDELKVVEDATDDGKKAIKDASKIDTTQLIEQEQLHQDQVAEKNVEGLMMQNKGIDMQINSTLQRVKFDERMGTAINAELKGDIQSYQQDCQQLANDVKTGVAQVPGIVKGLARTIGTHERQESGQYTLSKRGDKIEGMVLKQVDRFAGQDAQLGKKIYEDCKQEIHHEVGQLINNENETKTLQQIREKEAQKNQAMDQRAATD